MFWLSGDSWLDGRPLIKSGLRFEDTIEGLLKTHYNTLCFARGGSGNMRQLSLIESYMKFDVQFPKFWIHAWTEVGRDTTHLRYNNDCEDRMSVNISNKIIEIGKKLNCKILVFGGQAPIPNVAREILKEMVITTDWKAELLGTSDYGASQYFSIITEGMHHNLPNRELQKHVKLSYKQLNLLTKSEFFPDNAHPDAYNYRNLYKRIEDKINDNK
jgi:hypothetical protein